MKVVFRVDASMQIGTGHVMRCLTLAEELQNKAAEIYFICREMPGHLADFIRDKGHHVYLLSNDEINDQQSRQDSDSYLSWLGVESQQDAIETGEVLKNIEDVDWLVIDHYAIDEQWEAVQRDLVKKILVIDDLANRSHVCDVLLDQNFYHNFKTRYTGLLPDGCEQLLGPAYSLLRKEFRETRKKINRLNKEVKRLFIFFGGVDASNMTERVLQAIINSDVEKISIDAVIGKTNPHKQQIEKLCATNKNIVLHIQIDDMARMIAQADLCIGSGGTVTWERCCLGLPAIAYSVAENQRQLLLDSAKAGLVYVPDEDNPAAEDIVCDLKSMLHNSCLREHISQAGFAAVDGKGAVRVTNMMLASGIAFRKADLSDMQKVYDWRNDVSVRKYSHNSEIIGFAQHQEWFKNVVKEPNRPILIGCIGNKELGVVRFDISDNVAEISIYLTPDRQGMGYGAGLISAGEKWLKNQFPNVNKINAEILTENRASSKIFETCGYKSNTVIYQKSIV